MDSVFTILSVAFGLYLGHYLARKRRQKEKEHADRIRKRLADMFAKSMMPDHVELRNLNPPTPDVEWGYNAETGHWHYRVPYRKEDEDPS